MLGKLNRYLARVSIFLIAAALIAGMAGCGGGGYNPPPSQNLEIRTWYDLDAIRNNLSGSYLLMNDLDATTAGYEELASPTANNGTGWEPIGSYPYAFNGTFDGQGYEICDLFINRPSENGVVGLFGAVGQDGVIKNLGVVNVTVTGYIFVGGLVGANIGTVSNSYFTGSVTGTGNGMFGTTVGGLAGGNGGTVSNSYSTGNVTGQAAVGGLVGMNDGLGIVSNSYSSGSVTGYGQNVGGLAGVNGGTVSNSYSTGNVSGNVSAGGLVGANSGTVSNSYSTGNVTGNTSVGGLVGDNTATVSSSFWDMETSGQSTSAGGTGKNTTEMQDIATFSGAGWNITAVALNETNPAYIWNIVDNVTYPFLSWQA